MKITGFYHEIATNKTLFFIPARQEIPYTFKKKKQITVIIGIQVFDTETKQFHALPFSKYRALDICGHNIQFQEEYESGGIY